MTNLLVGDFIDFIFSKSFVVGIGIPFLPSTRADKALFHYHSTTTFYNLSFSFSHFCNCLSVALSSCVLVLAKSFSIVRYFYLAYFNPITSFWAISAICLSWIGKYYLLLVTYSLDGSIPFSRVLFRILTRITSFFANFCWFLVILNFFYFLEVFYA